MGLGLDPWYVKSQLWWVKLGWIFTFGLCLCLVFVIVIREIRFIWPKVTHRNVT